MVLEGLELQNFRSFKKASFEFPRDTTLIVGPNTSGKTNILEAIFLLALGRTFRPGLEREMIKFGEEIGRVKGRIKKLEVGGWELEEKFPPEADPPLAGEVGSGSKKDEGMIELEVGLTGGEVQGRQVALKRCLVNGVSRRQQDFVGNLVVVIFGPEDLELVTNSPSLRRAHLDFVLEQVDREYRRRTVVYSKALSQRNRLLKLISERRRSERELEYWDKLVVENGNYLTKRRREFFEFISKLPKKLGEFEFVYQPSQVSFDRLVEYQSQEIAAEMTLIGPHRDDFIFEIRNPHSEGILPSKQSEIRNLTIYGSRGEQRTAVLALKLAELEFMAHQSSPPKAGPPLAEIISHQPSINRPILLLDDIFSELDRKNREEVLKVIPKQQTIITTTDLGLVEKRFLDKMKIIELSTQIDTD